jgi:GTPase Era involved in 16S rRNA processing
MSLINYVLTGDAQGAELYLRNLALKSDIDLYTELLLRDEREMTALHLAVERADLQMVKILLSYGASVNARIGNSDIGDYAKSLAQANPKNEQRINAYALIKSRGRWLTDRGVSFSRSIKAIEDVTMNIRCAKDKEAALVVGVTGEGKSTFINYLCGVDYKRNKVNGVTRMTPLSSEYVKTGHSPTSETVYPQVIESKKQPYVLVDFPGFEDTKGLAEEVCAAAGSYMLTKQLRSIPAIVLVVSWNSLDDPKMLTYRKSAQNIGAMISLNPATAENVILIVTKQTADLNMKDVRARLRELSESEGWHSISNATPIKQEGVTADMWKKQCLKNTTQAILSRDGNIILADVTTSCARDAFHEILNKQMKISKKPDLFEFKNYSQFMNDFVAVLKNLCSIFLNMRNESIRLFDSSKMLDAEIDNLQLQKTYESKKCRDLYTSSSILFEKKYFEYQIVEMRERLVKLKIQQDDLSSSSRAYEAKYTQLAHDLVSNEASLLGTRQFLEAEKVRLARTLALAKNDPNAEVNRAISECNFLLEYQSEIIQSIRSDLSYIKSNISTCEQEKWVLQDKIRQEENLLAQETARFENEKTIHEERARLGNSKVVDMLKVVEKIDVHIALLTSRSASLSQDALMIKLELAINEDLFSTTREIIQVLELNSDVLDNFMLSFRINTPSSKSPLIHSLSTFLSHAPTTLPTHSNDQKSSLSSNRK